MGSITLNNKYSAEQLNKHSPAHMGGEARGRAETVARLCEQKHEVHMQ